MKQILVIMCLLIGTSWATVSAQKVQSTSRSLTIIREPKEPKVSLPHNWFVKAGAGILMGESDSFTGDESEMCFKPNIAFGYQKQFTKQGLYWGAQTGFTFMPIDYTFESFEGSPGIYLGPTFGIKKPINYSLEFDGHIGISGALSYNDGNIDFGPLWELGAGIWINRFLIELIYQGFSSDTALGNGILLNLGFKF